MAKTDSPYSTRHSRTFMATQNAATKNHMTRDLMAQS